ncbi:Sulfate transporter [Tieghemostelium lacteum]|uniref:Sulfate transporter n=1 Tax=Tieghemostelium lacteum TaxID=361077 RepID=A0A152A589_TIELA|nr:Sulfate transporter [Tieghemostelium lacteum]|eukprot:KYR01399.1 Sulfate transporter [Tieghemostelium lacteum]
MDEEEYKFELLGLKDSQNSVNSSSGSSSGHSSTNSQLLKMNSSSDIILNTIKNTTEYDEVHFKINNKLNAILKYFKNLLLIIVSTSIGMSPTVNVSGGGNSGNGNSTGSNSITSNSTMKRNNSITTLKMNTKFRNDNNEYQELQVVGETVSDHDSSSDDGHIQNEDEFYDSNREITKIRLELEKQILEKYQLKRDEIYLALSVIQDQSMIDDIIRQHCNHFMDSCYQDITDRFQFTFPRVIDMLKLMRNSPEHQMDREEGPNGYSHIPVLPLNKKPESQDQFNFRVFLTKKISKLHVINWSSFLSLIPITQWLTRYKLAFLKDDLIASLTVGFMIIPQSMAYAILAGLPPIYGLYSAFICPIIYGLFGTSNEISVGPVAMVSLLIPSIIDLPFNHPDYIMETLCLSLMSGLVLLAVGLLRAGFLIENLLSNPILMGFMQAASVLIIFSQLKNLTAIPISSHTTTIIQFMDGLIDHINNIHGYTVLLGLSSIAILLIFKFINNKIRYKIPIAVIMLLLGTLISFLIDAKKHGIKIVDEIPSGLPKPIAVPLTLKRAGKIIVGSFIISILGFVESISIAKKFSSVRKYSINPSQELLALGMCNIIGSMFQACPVTGSFSRTIVNFQANSRSRLSSILGGVIVGIVLLFLTPVFKYTPLCILSSIVIAAAVSLFEVRETIDLFKKGELLGFFELMFVFIITLIFGSEVGIVVAFCVSILHIIYFSSKPHLVTLGRIPGTLVFRNISHYPDARIYPGIKILRYDSRLTYYTVNNFRDLLYDQASYQIDDISDSISTTDGNDHRLRVVILDMVNVSTIDSTAIDVLNEILDSYHSNHIQILFSDFRSSVKRDLYRSGFFKRIPDNNIFTSTHLAVEFILNKNTI